MMEDGSYAITDPDGRYHLDGVRPEPTWFRWIRARFSSGQVSVDCTRDTRSAGSASSRLVHGFGGSLARADFHLTAGEMRRASPRRRSRAPRS